MNEIWQFIAAGLKAGRTLALMVVVESKGSAPGKRGFKMALDAQTGQLGTIGGGIMEFRLMDKARHMIDRGEQGTCLIRQVHRDRAPESIRSGMICAGSQQIAITLLAPDRLDMVQLLASQAKGLLQIDGSGLSFLPSAVGEPVLPCRTLLTGEWRYQEVAGQCDTVYIIGGGHVGLAVSRAMATLDFRVVVCDHRADLAIFKTNPYAHQKIVIEMDQLGAVLPDDPGGYVVIVTTAMVSDIAALAALIHKRLAYIGLMGSAVKLKTIFAKLGERGVAPETLAKVSAPIGIPIGNRTPAEIAISVAAEIVAVRNGRRGFLPKP